MNVRPLARRTAASGPAAIMALGLASAAILGARPAHAAAGARTVGGHSRAGLTTARPQQSGPRDWPA
ncbi:MAG: hypothetical protein ACTHKL_13015, partial [Streptosporangiaceae bacterium]